MRVGVPAETKVHEYRVGVTPAGVRELTRRGHEVLLQAGAGTGSAIADAEYETAGAKLVPDAQSAWDSDLVVKVKEPVEGEFGFLREGLTLFAYLHLAAAESLTARLLETRTRAIAFETVEDARGGLPLLAPMSEIAGRMAPQVGATMLQAEHGGRGTLLGGVSGVSPAHVIVLGGGNTGRQAALIAAGFQAHVTVLDLDTDKLRAIDALGIGRITTITSSTHAIEERLEHADLVIGAVLSKGARAPVLISAEMVRSMPAGSVIVDVSIDQGGCVETSRVTTHDKPAYEQEGVIHYCVGNMPGAVPRTSTYALANATLPYLLRLADGGLDALRADPGFGMGLNAFDGVITNLGVAQAHGLGSAPVEEVLHAA